jgi:hypothetical protein
LQGLALLATIFTKSIPAAYSGSRKSPKACFSVVIGWLPVYLNAFFDGAFCALVGIYPASQKGWSLVLR